MKLKYDPPKPHKGIPVYIDGVLFDKMTMSQYDAVQACWPNGAYVVRVYEEKKEIK